MGPLVKKMSGTRAHTHKSSFLKLIFLFHNILLSYYEAIFRPDLLYGTGKKFLLADIKNILLKIVENVNFVVFYMS